MEFLGSSVTLSFVFLRADVATVLLAVSGGYKGLSHGLYENDYQITVDNGGEHATCVSEKHAHMCVERICLHV